MDRRQKRTLNYIYKAFESLLKKKKYDQITIQDIVDEADVARSTFYMHFETKDDLLNKVCDEIFDCVFPHGFLPPCGYHDEDGGLEGKLAHIFTHLKESHTDIIGRLSSDGEEIFMSYFKKHMESVFTTYVIGIPEGMSKNFLMNHLTCSFVDAVKWWFRCKTEKTPEEMARYYVLSLPSGIKLSEKPSE